MALHYEDDGLALHVFVSGYSNNAWLLIWKATSESLIIDTPGDPVELIAAASRTDVTAILITHNHWDHLEGFKTVVERFPVPVGIGGDDAHEVEKLGVSPSLDVSDGDIIACGGLSLRAIHTPGHTPGSTCYFLEGSGTHLFSGDTLFPGGPGRTSSPDNLKQIVESISSRLLVLPDNTAVRPGHGADTTVREARREYQAFASKSHPPELCGDVTWLGT